MADKKGVLYVVKIVIVEDDPKTQEEVSRIIKTTDIAKEEMQIEIYDRYNEKLEEEIKNQDMRKIYILDIELGQPESGMNIAKQIRATDWESEIIFITNHDKMFETAHRSVFNVYDFIEKFNDLDEKLKKDINLIYHRSYDNQMLVINKGNVHLQIYYSTITHIIRDKETRKINIYTDNNRYIVNMSMKEIKEYLSERFENVHRACIVNMNRIAHYEWNNGYFEIDNGKKVYMISKSYKKDIEKHYNDHK